MVLSSWFAFLLLITLDFFAPQQNPYVGILIWLVSPAFLVAGLIMMGIGRLIQSRRLKHMAEGAPIPKFVIDVNRPEDRKKLVVFACGSAVFLLVTAIGSYQSYHVTESVQFCGQACHEPMKPQFVSYQNSPHAKVACSACHIGPGAVGYFKAKFNGIHQLYAVAANDFHRPINGHEKIHIDQKTCEQCHWPQRYVGTIEKSYNHFLADETNTTFSVRLLMKVGGGDATHGPPGGIHWHMNIANKIEYVATDDQKQKIPWVRMTDPSGKVTIYKTKEFKDDPAAHKIQRMDCMDCHNRPAHQFRTPNEEVDLAMSIGKIDPSLKWVKSNSVAVLIAPYKTENEAVAAIATTLGAKYPNNEKTASLIAAVQDIYKTCFFPEMKTDWRVHANNIGHKDYPGCFRCHDGEHKSTTNAKDMIKASDCNACHIILAQGSGPDLEKLSPKGHAFFHLDGEYSDYNCNTCHSGAFPK